jgi:hypothetical protein
MKNQEIEDYLLKNVDYLYGNYQEVADKFKVHYDVIRRLAKKLRPSIVQQPVETPIGYQGMLKAGKVWQLPNGEWRESIHYKVDELKNWNEFKNNFLNDLKQIYKPDRKDYTIHKASESYLLEISLPDLHFGKGDVNELIDKFHTSVNDLVYKARNHNISKILLPIGNDGLNSEGKRQTTTAGTPQQDTINWQESFRVYWTNLCKVIKRLTDIAPVEVVIITGNHDEERMFYIGDVLLAYFNNDLDVTINNSGEYRKYFEYGINMLMFTHGNEEKHSDLPLIMATEQPEMFARTKYREVHLGHLHKEKMDEYRGIKVKFLPSICTTDEWHKKKGYNHMRCAQAFLYNYKHGLEGILQKNHLE